MRVAKVTEQEWRTLQKGRRRKVHRYLRCQKFSRLNREFFQWFKAWGRPAVQRLLGGLCVVGGLAVYCMMHGQPDCGEIMFGGGCTGCWSICALHQKGAFCMM